MTSLQYPSASLNLPQYTGDFIPSYDVKTFVESDLDLTAAAWSISIDQAVPDSKYPAFIYTIFDAVTNNGVTASKANIKFKDWSEFDKRIDLLVIAFAEAINGYRGTYPNLHDQIVACPFAWAKPVGDKLITYARNSGRHMVTTVTV